MAIPMFRSSVSRPHQNFRPFSNFLLAKVNSFVPKNRRLVSCTLSESKSIGSKEVSFSVGTHLIPHPNKVDRGGEDAFFVSTYNGGVIAVADGVSSFSELRLNSLKLSTAVVDGLCQLAKTSCLSELMLGVTSIGTDGALKLMESLSSETQICHLVDGHLIS